MRIRFIITLVLLVNIQTAFSGDSLFLSNSIVKYSAEEYNLSPINNDIVQTPNGIIYTINKEGVLEYDGARWKTILLRNNLKSIAIDSAGTIFIGSTDDFGSLEMRAGGTYIFNSLKDFIPEQANDVQDVYTIQIVKEKVYFITFSFLYCYSNNEIKYWQPLNHFHDATVFNNELYLRDCRMGVVKLLNDSIHDIYADCGYRTYPGSHNKQFLYNNADNIIINTVSGLKYFTDYAVTELDDKLYTDFDSVSIVKIEKDAEGNLIVFTKAKGIYKVKQANNKIETLTHNFAFNDIIINKVIKGQQNEFWLATSNGILKLDPCLNRKLLNLSLPITRLAQAKGVLHIGTYNGLYEVNQNSIEKIAGINEKCNNIAYLEKGIVVAGKEGLFLVKDNIGNKLLCSWPYFNDVVVLKHPDNRIIASSKFGIVSLREENKQYIAEEPLLFNKASGTIINSNNDLWVHQLPNKIAKIELGRQNKVSGISSYEINRGKETINVDNIAKINNSIIALTAKGLYEYNVEFNQFLPYTIHSSFSGNDSLIVKFLKQIDENRIFFSAIDAEEKKICGISTIGHKDLPGTFISLRNISSESIADVIYYKEKDELYIAGDKVYKYQLSLKTSKPEINQVNIRNIVLNNESVLFNGAENNIHIPSIKNTFSTDLRIEFSLPYFIEEELTRYSYLLEGKNEEWSAFREASTVYFNNLPSGEYTFRVRAKDTFGQISEEATISFTLIDVWFKSKVAYIVYLLIVILAFVSAVLIYRRKKKQLNKDKLTINFSDNIYVSNDDKLLQRIAEIINKNIQETNLNVDFLSRELGMTRQTLHLKLKTLCKQSPSEFIRTIKLEKAAEMLKNSSGNVSEIAFQVGFESNSYFSKKFKEKYNISPSLYASSLKKIS